MANGQWRGFAPTCLPSLPSISSIFSEFPRLSASVLYLTLIFMIAHLYINRCFAFSGLSGLPLSLLAYCADFIIIFIWHGWHKKQSEEQDRKENSFSCSAAARHRQTDIYLPWLSVSIWFSNSSRWRFSRFPSSNLSCFPQPRTQLAFQLHWAHLLLSFLLRRRGFYFVLIARARDLSFTFFYFCLLSF